MNEAWHVGTAGDFGASGQDALKAALLSRAKDLAPLIERHAAATEANGTVTQEVVEALRQAELFWLTAPAALGGLGASLTTEMAVIEEISRADPSTGWALVANITAITAAAAFCADEAIDGMFGGGKRPIIAGMLGPNGYATEAADGYRVSGKFSFGSGCAHANWICAGFFVKDIGGPRKLPDGTAEVRGCFLPREAVHILGSWNVIGLVGTGSYDYEVPEQFVSRNFSIERTVTEPRRGPAWYGVGIAGLGCAGHAGVVLGLMKRALEEAGKITTAKKRPGYPSAVADHPVFTREFARHEAFYWGARGFLMDVFSDAQNTLVGGAPLTGEQRARLRQATTWAHNVAAKVVKFCHMWCGSEAIRAQSVLGRVTRDTFVATQHVFVDPITMVDAARPLLARWQTEGGLAQLGQAGERPAAP